MAQLFTPGGLQPASQQQSLPPGCEGGSGSGREKQGDRGEGEGDKRQGGRRGQMGKEQSLRIQAALGLGMAGAFPAEPPRPMGYTKRP